MISEEISVYKGKDKALIVGLHFLKFDSWSIGFGMDYWPWGLGAKSACLHLYLYPLVGIEIFLEWGLEKEDELP